MYETVKTVNGYAITRMKGTQRFYTVVIKEIGNWKQFQTFHTIKSAAAFCETLPIK